MVKWQSLTFLLRLAGDNPNRKYTGVHDCTRNVDLASSPVYLYSAKHHDMGRNFTPSS